MDVKKDIAFLIEGLGNGGSERQLFYLIDQLSKDKTWNIHLIIWHFNQTDKYYLLLKEHPINIVAIDRSLSFFGKLNQIRKIISETKPLLLHNYSFHLNFLAAIATMFTQTRAIGALRSSIIEKYKQSKLRTIINLLFPKYIISNNHKSVEQLERFPFLANKIHVIQNKLDIKSFDFSDSTRGETFISCSIGRVDENKRIDIIIEAVKRLKNKGIQLVHRHAGSGVLIDTLRERVVKEKLTSHFEFVGQISNVSQFISNANLFIHTSRSEGTPNVIMEAISCGRPVITTDCGDVRHFVKDNHNGFVIPENNVESLVVAYQTLLTDENLSFQMGKRGRVIAEEKFNIDDLLKHTLDFYHKKMGFTF